MKRVKFVKILTAAAVLGITGVISLNQVHAADTYKLVKTKKYKKAKTYHAVNLQAELLDKHLVRDKGKKLSGFSHMTWYATAEVTYHHKGVSSKYLRVHSGNKKATGYIWHGYLKKGKFKALSPNLPEYLYEPLYLNRISRDYIDNNLNQKIVDLFPGARWDNQVQLAADFSNRLGASGSVVIPNFDKTATVFLPDYILGKDNAAQVISFTTAGNYKGKPANLMKFIRQRLTKKLTKMGKTLHDFNGYRIGAYGYSDKVYHEDKDCGKVTLYLVPPKVKLPKLGKVYFDPVNLARFDSLAAISDDFVNEKLDDQVADLFTWTLKDNQLNLAARMQYAEFAFNYSRVNAITDILGKNSNVIELRVDKVSPGKSLTNQEALAVIKKKLDDSYTKYNGYQGYRIGVYVAPFEDKKVGGMTEILLVPPAAKLPKLGKYTFDINRDNILQ